MNTKSRSFDLTVQFKDIEKVAAKGKRAARATGFASSRRDEKKRSFVSFRRSRLFGAHGREETPVPIPNTEVKLSSGDYTALSGKLARCRIMRKTTRKGGLLRKLLS